jgi:hypothetical protein
MTDNHGYNTPEAGTTDWDVPLNNNFHTLDADVEIRDDDANRTDYQPKSGAKFLATDTGAVYLGDGSRWVHTGDIRELAGNVYVQSGTPSAPSRGDIWVDTDGPTLSFYDGSQWVSVDGGSTSDSGSGSDTESTVEDGKGDLSAYTGETDYFGITTDSIAGEGSVQTTGAEYGSYRTIVSTSGLPAYPEAGDTFRCQVAVDTYSTYGGVLWGVQSGSSPWPCYRLIIDTGASPGVRFEKVPTSGPIQSHELPDANRLSDDAYHDDSAYEPVEGKVYTVEVEWGTDGVMPWSVTDSGGTVLAEDTSPTADTEYTGGGIGFLSSRSWDDQPEARARFDNYELI